MYLLWVINNIMFINTYCVYRLREGVYVQSYLASQVRCGENSGGSMKWQKRLFSYGCNICQLLILVILKQFVHNINTSIVELVEIE